MRQLKGIIDLIFFKWMRVRHNLAVRKLDDAISIAMSKLWVVRNHDDQLFAREFFN